MVLAASVGLAPISLGGCGAGKAVQSPVDWWHGLQGGEIAANRPPPPGANLPYPHVFSVPAKPTPPSSAFRQTVQGELTQDRDATERLAARTPIDLSILPPPPPPKPPQPSAAQDSETANASLPAADPPKPSAPAAAAAAVVSAADGGPPPGTPVTLAGAPPDEANLPQIPAAPPSPPTFEAVAAQPAPSPEPPLPASAALPPSGAARVLFATGDATLGPSQKDTLRDVVAHRGKASIAVEGHGESASDTPGAQQAALDLGLKRAGAVATALGKLHVPADKILLSATAFGRDVIVRDQ